MARIVGAIATSHTPTIGFAVDGRKQQDPVWKPIFDAYVPITAWLNAQRPDVLFIVYNDHVTSFFFDHYSAFCLGIGEEYAVADEGGGPRKLPPIKAHGPLARHIGRHLVADEFDMSFFQDKPLDHGCFSPLSMLLPHDGQGWAMPIVPLQVGVLQFPVPSAKRCFRLGQSLRAAIESYPEDLKVVLVATGGLSHQVHGERCGFNNPPWDHRLMDLYENDPVALTLDDPRRSRPAGRHGEHGVRDVADCARRAVVRGEAGPPELLPPFDGRNRDRDLREPGRADDG
jgi:gallate dioxygenase